MNILIFLVETAFDLYIYLMIIRLLLQLGGASYYNQVVQAIVTLTKPLINPLRRVFPSYYGFDFAIIIVTILLKLIEYTLLTWLQTFSHPALGPLLSVSIGELLKQLLNIYFFSIILQAIFSWFNPSNYNPLQEIFFCITEPVLKPARKIIPTVNGIDLSPIPVLILIQIILMFVLTGWVDTSLQHLFYGNTPNGLL